MQTILFKKQKYLLFFLLIGLAKLGGRSQTPATYPDIFALELSTNGDPWDNLSNHIKPQSGIENNQNATSENAGVSQTLKNEATERTYSIQIWGSSVGNEPDIPGSCWLPYTKNQFEVIYPTALAVSTESLLFYDVFIGNTNLKKTTLTNNGITNIRISAVNLTGLNADQFSIKTPYPFEIAAGSSWDITVEFAPGSSGAKEADVVLVTNSPDIPPKIITLKGYGTDHESKVLNIDSSTLYFGDTKLYTGRNKTVSIQNSGSNPCSISNLNLEGFNPDQYSITFPTVFPFDIGSGETKTIYLKFEPTIIGSKNAEVVISNNSDNISPKQAIELYGNGIANSNSEKNNKIVAYRYWFDRNETDINTVILPSPANPFLLDQNITTCSLSEGDHSIHFQFLDSNHLWSSVFTDTITKSAIIKPEITVTGEKTICQGNQVILTASAGDSYLWNNGETIQSISVSETGNYSVTVTKNSGCGVTSEVTAIVVNPLPKSGGVIAGKNRVARNQSNVTYSVAAIDNATSYIWTLPIGATGSSTTNSISVSFGNDAASGEIKVFGQNNCGNGPESSLAITVSSVLEQDISLSTGWNIISADVIPSYLDLKTLFQPLINTGKLKKVMDESGKTIENFGAFGGWKNNIGNLAVSKGYKVNVTESSILSFEGVPVSLPLDISLTVGWNIISYPSTASQDAKALFQPLIDAGKLKKVMDESGKTIENFGAFGGWKNNIGNVVPGKGYKVNVTESCMLTIPASGTKSAVRVPELLASTHFRPVYIGNGTDHHNVNLVDLQSSGLQEGDEIGIFDGDLCVGSATIGAEQMHQGAISIPASCNDNLSEKQNGFTPGHPVELQLYRGNRFYTLDQTKISGTESFEKDESLFVEVNCNELQTPPPKSDSFHFKCYPNPFSGEITIEIQDGRESTITVNIYSITGQKIRNLFNGPIQNVLVLKWDGTNDAGQLAAPGIYLCNVNGMSKQVILERKR